jgi:two-component system sensor histidine kinase PilS (NtrC family)
MNATAAFDPAVVRGNSLRYLNLFRLIMAAVFAVFGTTLGLGLEAPALFVGLAVAYLVMVLVLGFPDAARRIGLERLITLQVLLDILFLSLAMWVSGGYRSGLPMLMMVVLAGAGLVGKGRMVLFFAAVATLAVLVENGWRAARGFGGADFFAVGVVCIGFFGVAVAGRLLAVRAMANESLAAERGRALAKQQAVNERIIQDMNDGVVVLDGQGHVLQSNPQAQALLGSTLPVRSGLRDLVPELAAGAAESLAGGGQPVWVKCGRLLRCRALGAGEGGDTLVYLEDFEDIQRQTQQVKLAALGRLTASMAHEIRNPLSAVTHAADLLKDERRGEMQVRLIRIIRDNARRIDNLVTNVLALGRRDTAVPEAIPLGPYLEDLVDELSLHEPEGRAVFAVEIPPGLSLVVDRAHLHQILGNLLGNARRYCSGRPGSVRVWAEVLADSRLSLHVLDDGPGVPAEHTQSVFEPFFTTHSKGIGLGLYIARELAEANGASLELRENGEGAHFRLTGRQKP